MGQNDLFFFYAKTWFLICNINYQEFHLDNIKGDFLNILIFLDPHIPDFQIVVTQPNIVLS